MSKQSVQRNWMNIDYQYCVCHGGQRWLVWGLAEALVSILWIRIAQIDTKTHLPTELILHSPLFGCFSCVLYQLHPFLYSFSWLLKGERWHVPGLVCNFFFFFNPAISSATFADCRVTTCSIFPLSSSPCEIDRLFARSSNRAGRGLKAVLATQAEAEMLLGKEAGERQEVLPALTVGARDLGGHSELASTQGGGTARQATVHTRRNLYGRAKRCSTGPVRA